MRNCFHSYISFLCQNASLCGNRLKVDTLLLTISFWLSFVFLYFILLTIQTLITDWQRKPKAKALVSLLSVVTIAVMVKLAFYHVSAIAEYVHLKFKIYVHYINALVLFLAHLSTECSVSYCDHLLSVVFRPSGRPSIICLFTL